MARIKRTQLMNGENIILYSPKHWKNYIFPCLTVCLLLILVAIRRRYMKLNIINILVGNIIIPREIQGIISTLEICFLLFLMLKQFIHCMNLIYTEYIITDRRVISSSGLVRVKTTEIMLSKCETVTLKQNAYERMFNTGDILVVSAGASIYLDDVRDARQFKLTLLELLSKE